MVLGCYDFYVCSVKLLVKSVIFLITFILCRLVLETATRAPDKCPFCRMSQLIEDRRYKRHGISRWKEQQTEVCWFLVGRNWNVLFRAVPWDSAVGLDTHKTQVRIKLGT